MAAFNRATHTDAKRKSLHPDGRRLLSQLALTFRTKLPPECQTPQVTSSTGYTSFALRAEYNQNLQYD